MRYVIFVIDDSTEFANTDEMVAIDAFNDQMRADGHFVYATGMNAPSSAKLIDNRAGRGSIIDQSLYQSKEHYSGFWIIDVPTKERAMALALAGSQACNRKVELRRLNE
jgi:hypothetical protein